MEEGVLEERARRAVRLLGSCRLCPRRCGVNRAEGELGYCRTGRWAVVSSYGPHFGEERPLVGRGGSGTIFFSWCNLRCVYCQNYEISQLGLGSPVDADDLATMMLSLQRRGCHNINLVSPSHVVPQVLEALVRAAREGLRLPLVYNTGGYDQQSTLRLLDGVVDIYMPDVKYGSSEPAGAFSDAPDYVEVNRIAVKEMHRQVGDLQLDEHGIARRGLLVRHLVLPGDLAASREVFRFLAEEVSPNTYVNVMSQYRPYHRARHHAGLARSITPAEYARALEMAKEAGLRRLDQRFRLWFP